MAKAVNIKINLEKALAEKKVLKGLVTSCEDYNLSEESTQKRLLVHCLDSVIIIEEEDIVMPHHYATLKSYIGEKVNFTIKAIIENNVYGSMKEAKEIVEKPILEKLYAGEVLEGIITYITPFGAYITIDGKLSGLMKNYDFSDDGTEIREIYSKYSKIKVKYKKTTLNGNIVFLPEERRKGKELYNIKDIKKGQFFKGKVTNITPDFEWVSVTISSNIVVGCYFPQNFPYLKNGDEVTVKIGKIEHDETKDKYHLHGRIHTIINNSNTSF